ncbi:hypothetical protein Tco_1256801 [Tanacetum coccineum]
MDDRSKRAEQVCSITTEQSNWLVGQPGIRRLMNRNIEGTITSFHGEDIQEVLTKRIQFTSTEQPLEQFGSAYREREKHRVLIAGLSVDVKSGDWGDLKAQTQDKNIAISELKKFIEKCKGKSVETQFDKPSVVRQPNAQRIPKPSVLGKPTPFSNSPEMRSFQTKQSVNKTNVSDGLFKQVTQQNLPQNRKQAEIHSNVLKPGMYRIATTTTQNREPQLPHASRNTNPHVSKSSGVNHTTSVSRPQLKCYQVKDKVVPNNSQVKFKKKEVEDHHRISSISKKTKSVTACNDSSNSRTSNVNVVCAECGKCVFNSNHDACVSRYLNDVNARTKKPNVVPISASKPKRKMNKSVATPHKKTVASDTTI